MILTKRIWAAKPFLVAYVVAIGFVIGLLINRTPGDDGTMPAVAGAAVQQHGAADVDEEVKEPPLWTQIFRPDQPTARLLLRTGIPLLAIVDGSAFAEENRNLKIYSYWTGKAGGKPQTFFQAMLPFLRNSVIADKGPDTPKTSPQPVQPGPQIPPEQPQNQAPRAGPQAPGAKDPVNKGLPLVGIYSTHDYESYISEFPQGLVKGENDLWKVASYDHARKTVVTLGNTLAVELKSLGVATVHAPFPHQDLGYSFAYRSSRTTVKEILRKVPSTKVLLDLHRDGVWGLDTKVTIQGKPAAKIRCIIGKDQQPNWEKNKAFCDKLITRLEKTYPGLTLPTMVKDDTYNQDLLPGAILLEIGGAMNRYEEAEESVKFLAKVLAAMIRESDYPK